MHIILFFMVKFLQNLIFVYGTIICTTCANLFIVSGDGSAHGALAVSQQVRGDRGKSPAVSHQVRGDCGKSPLEPQ